MDQTTYTDEEVTKVLQDLFLEKKRVKEMQRQIEGLEHQLQSRDEASSNGDTKVATVMNLDDPKLEKMIDENLKLKKLALALKKKLEQGEREPSEALQGRLHELEVELKSKADDVEAARKHSKAHQERLSEKAEECADLRRSLESIQAANTELSRDLEKAKKYQAEAERLRKERQQAPDTSKTEEQLRLAQNRLQATISARDLAVEEREALQQKLKAAQDQLAIATSHQGDDETQALIAEKLALSKELESTRANFNANRTKLEEVKEQALRDKQHNDKLVERLQRYETQIQELQDFEYSYKKQGEQKLALEHSLQQDRRLVQALQQEKSALGESLAEKESALNQAQNKVSELTLAYESAQASTAHMKSRLMETERARENWLNEKTELTRQLNAKDTEIEKVKETVRLLEEHSGNSAQELARQKETVDQYGEELHLIKQALIRGVREAKELEMRFMEMVNEKVAAVNKGQQAEKIQEQQAAEIRDLQNRLSETSSSNRQLQTRLEDLQLSIEAADAHKGTLKERIAKLEAEAEAFSGTRNALHEELSEREYRIESLQQSLEQAETAVSGMEEEKDKLAERLTQTELAMQIMEREKKDMESLADEQRRREHGLHAQLEELQQAMDSAQGEKERLVRQQEEYLLVIEGHRGQIDTLEQQVTDLQIRTADLNQAERTKQEISEKYELLREEFLEVKTEAEEAMDARSELEKQVAVLRDRLDENQHAQNTLNQQLTQAYQETEQLKGNIAHMQTDLEDRDERVTSAQQHLAKKVKEHALLMEKQEEARIQSMEFQNQINSFKAKINEQKNSLDLQRQQEKKLQDLLNESIKSAESQVGKWEKKYFQAYDKWQDGENLNKELKQEIDSLNSKLQQLEQKHRQVTSLLGKLGSFLGGNPLASALNGEKNGPQAPTPEELAVLTSSLAQQEAPHEAVPTKEMIAATLPTRAAPTQQELFAGGAGAGKSRQNLFD